MLRSIILLVIALLLPTAADTFAPSLTAYDGNSNLLRRIDANSQIIDSDFDELNRMTQRRWSGGATANAQPTDILREVSTHDANGQLISQSQFEQGGTSHTVSNVFDRQRRLSTETDRFGVSTTHEYDAQDNRIARIDPSGRSVFGFDPLNRLRSVQPAVGASTESPVALAYTDAGRLKQQFAPNGAHSEHVYDPAGRIKTLIHTQTGVEVARFEYAYDGNGNRSGQSQTTPAGIRTTTYRYDRDDRLIGTDERTEGGRLIATLTTLDAVGNRKTEAVTDNGVATQTRSYAYSPRHALQSRSDSVDGNTVSYSHDANGSLTRETSTGSARGSVPASTTSYRRNPQDRLATLTAPTGPPVDYHYDSRGLRVEKRSTLAATRFGYDGRRLRRETNVANNLLATYEWAAGRLVHSQQQSNTRYPQHDALATPIRWSSSDGAEQGKRTIDAWGTTTTSTGSLPPIGFTGHYLDAESGDYYAQQRYYRPGLGRFSRIDPWEGDASNPISLNKYLYGNGNPTFYTDPDGRCGVAGIALRYTGWIGVCNAIDSRMIGTNDAGAIQEYREGQGVGILRSLKDSVVGAAQLAGDLAVSARERITGEDFGASDRIGASVAGGIEVASSPRLTMTDYIERNVNKFDAAIASQNYAAAGKLTGQVSVDATGAVTGAGGAIRGSVALSRKFVSATAATEGRLAATVVEGADARAAARYLDPSVVDDLEGAYGAAGSVVEAPPVLRNQAAGNAARDAIASERPGSLIEQNFRVTGGLRRVDVLDGSVAIESKVGRTSLTSVVRRELARDTKLLRTGQVDSVEWHFGISPTTGRGGPTGPLRNKLQRVGIPVVEKALE